MWTSHLQRAAMEVRGNVHCQTWRKVHESLSSRSHEFQAIAHQKTSRRSLPFKHTKPLSQETSRASMAQVSRLSQGSLGPVKATCSSQGVEGTSFVVLCSIDISRLISTNGWVYSAAVLGFGETGILIATFCGGVELS